MAALIFALISAGTVPHYLKIIPFAIVCTFSATVLFVHGALIDNFTDYTLTCTTTQMDADCPSESGNSVINCPTDANCDIRCEETYACKDSIINCPTNGNCDITCNANFPCRNSVINCPKNGDCSLYCSDVHGCSRATINCPDNGKCDIDCHGHYSVLCTCPCKSVPTTSDLLVVCHHDVHNYYKGVVSGRYPEILIDLLIYKSILIRHRRHLHL